MNQREKLQAQLELLQDLKSDFSRNLIIPYVEDYAGLETERDSGVLAVSVYCNQKDFEERLEGNICVYLNDVESELEEKLKRATQEETNAYAQTMETLKKAVNNGDTLPYTEK